MSEKVEVHPADAHNLALLANVHPPAWTNPEPPPRYNLVVIGAGLAGLGWLPQAASRPSTNIAHTRSITRSNIDSLSSSQRSAMQLTTANDPYE